MMLCEIRILWEDLLSKQFHLPLFLMYYQILHREISKCYMRETGMFFPRGTGASSEILVGWILQEERGEGRIEQAAWNTELY